MVKTKDLYQPVGWVLTALGVVTVGLGLGGHRVGLATATLCVGTGVGVAVAGIAGIFCGRKSEKGQLNVWTLTLTLLATILSVTALVLNFKAQVCADPPDWTGDVTGYHQEYDGAIREVVHEANYQHGDPDSSAPGYGLACEHQTLSANCPAGKVIRIVSALYGRTQPEAVCAGPVYTTQCRSTTSLTVVQGRCNGQQSCLVTASNSEFGDPCVGTFKYLEIEYECTDTERPRGPNLALGKPTQQSSVGYDGVPERAVDGVENGVYSADSCTHTQLTHNPWWRVDLGSSRSIGDVVVFNRQDCCSERLSPFQVHVGDSPDVMSNPTCGGDHAVPAGQPAVTVDCRGRTGRYVGILLPTRQYLTLCEVQVYEDVQIERLGCWTDTADRAIPTVEGSDPRLDRPYQSRQRAFQKCQAVALSLNFSVFALQNGGWCASSAEAGNTYKMYGPSGDCRDDGEGGPWANEVYKITQRGSLLNELVCEHQTASLQCPDTQQIRVVSASYGRTDGTVCGGPVRTTECRSRTSLSAVKGACDARQSCVVSAENSVFGDPCVGTFKYLEVQYACIATPDMPRYLGCYEDHRERIFPSDRMDSDDMTSDLCIQHCREYGHQYAATQYAHECWCGSQNDFVGIGGRRPDSECDLPCPGGSTSEQMCGGTWRMSVYRIGGAEGPDPVGLWPFNEQYGAGDATGNGNDGVATGTRLVPGPFGNVKGALLFSGTANSYVDIPNNGDLDVRSSYTILAHIFPTGEAGPIFNYVGNNNQWAVHLWQTAPQDLFMRTVGRDGHFSPAIGATVLQQNAWNYVGGTYDSSTGVSSIWNNGELARQKQVGVPAVASQYPIRVGKRDGDSRIFSGRIACLQLYNFAMTADQIAAARDKCGALTPPRPIEPFGSQLQRLGCWADTADRAVPTLEGSDPGLDGRYESRTDVIRKCRDAAARRGYNVFAIQNGGWCAASADALQTYQMYGRSDACHADGEGGPWANEVYKIVTRPQPQPGLVCERSTMSIQCPAHKVIHIQSAMYGRVPGGSVCGTVYTGAPCRSPTSLSVLQERCDGREACSVRAENGVFGDPCVGTNKYLAVEYECVRVPGYKGCYEDIESRKFPADEMQSDKMTPEMCVRHCKDNGHAYAATQYSRECWCGSEDHFNGLGSRLPETECDKPCPGDADRWCGGTWRMSVYRVQDRDVCETPSTDTQYRYRWDLPRLTGHRFTFEVQANNDAHVALSSQSQDMDDMYEIVIGGWSNTQSVIRRSKQGNNHATASTSGINSPTEYRTFWITWSSDGTIAVGRGGETQPFMQWTDPDPLPIAYAGYTTGWGSTGRWKFCHTARPAETGMQSSVEAPRKRPSCSPCRHMAFYVKISTSIMLSLCLLTCLLACLGYRRFDSKKFRNAVKQPPDIFSISTAPPPGLTNDYRVAPLGPAVPDDPPPPYPQEDSPCYKATIDT
ncbi:CPAMD8 [Branchiostoma lanceolatum]|uniref:CPAMD8 protein n=1 Tax=Branchiostoma lanceolatum TaxID=7740 RepID=A0A8K0A2U0_BRALA|nr:CPAMD8 [Branchiostoma lanceolatum]